MTTFNELIPTLSEIIQDFWPDLQSFLPIFINRNLNGNICLILDASHQQNFNESSHPLHPLAKEINKRLVPHVGEVSEIFMFEEDPEKMMKSSCSFGILDRNGHALPDVYVIDRLAQESTWGNVENPSTDVPRVVYYSINGGVGRTTAAAASALALAKAGKRVMVLDLNIESPGLSPVILTSDQVPKFGVVDWLVEDLLNNGDSVIHDIYTISQQSSNGEIIVVPAHGRDPGEYISKLGRVCMPCFQADRSRQIWSERLCRLISELELLHQPDVVLIDSSSGINEFSSAFVTDLGAQRIYLFARDNMQTWTGYSMIFNHWHQYGVYQNISKRLQIVGSMMPKRSPRGQFYKFCNYHNICTPIFTPWNQSFFYSQFNQSNSDIVDLHLLHLIFGRLIINLKELI